MREEVKALIKQYGEGCTAGNVEMAERLGCSPRTIQNHIAWLRDNGLIELERKYSSGSAAPQRVIKKINY